jgi:hypothetical protein
MARKAQMEFIVLLGLIFVGAAVIYLVYQGLTYNPSSAPIGISEEEKTLRRPVEDLFKSAAEDALRVMEFQGGYSNYGAISRAESVPTIKFLEGNVRYWSRCENTMIPDFDNEIKPIFRRYIEKFIDERLEYILNLSYRDVKVDLDGLEVSVDFSSNNMMTVVTIPITIENYTINPKYVINTPTKFREIYSFAGDFSREQTTNRHLERFTISSLYFSPDLPTNGMLTNCGEFMVETPFSIADGLKKVAKFTMMNMHLWLPPRARVANEQNNYYLERVNGNSYPTLDVRFAVPDKFDFTTYSDPIIITNNKWLSTQFPFIIPACLTNYNIRYNVVYPYVVNVKDSLSGNLFNFAGMVYVDSGQDPREGGSENRGMVPGSCDAIDINLLVTPENACQCNEKKYAEISVASKDGEVTDADVAYGSCKLSYDKKYGKYRGEVACTMDTDIIISKEGYEFIQERTKDTELKPSYYLNRIPNVKVNFYEAVTAPPSTCAGNARLGMGALRDPLEDIYSYRCDIKSITSDMIMGSLIDENEWPIVPNIDGVKSKACFDQNNVNGLNDEIKSECSCNLLERIFGCDEAECMENKVRAFMDSLGECIVDSRAITSSAEMSYVPGNHEYTFSVATIDVHGFYSSGGLLSKHTLNESDHSLYMYIPKISAELNKYELTDAEKSCLTNYVKGVCGIDDFERETVFPYERVVDAVPGKCCEMLALELQAKGQTFSTWNAPSPCGGLFQPVCTLACNMDDGISRLANLGVKASC